MRCLFIKNAFRHIYRRRADFTLPVPSTCIRPSKSTVYYEDYCMESGVFYAAILFVKAAMIQYRRNGSTTENRPVRADGPAWTLFCAKCGGMYTHPLTVG